MRRPWFFAATLLTACGGSVDDSGVGASDASIDSDLVATDTPAPDTARADTTVDARDTADTAPDASDAPREVEVDVVDAPLVCETGTTVCGVACVDLHVDPKNCGACGAKCDCPGTLCTAGACMLECSAGMTMCGDPATGCPMCTDTRNDPNHCGSCAIKCPPGMPCTAGACD
jgi:hypothetical protein